MADASVIGRGTRVRGRIGGDGDLEIHGFLEGEATVGGDLTVEGTAVIAANLSARRIVIRGAVRGDVTAEEYLSLEDGARVVGALRAPRFALGQGALVRGDIHAGDTDFLKESQAKANTTPKSVVPSAAPARTAVRPVAPVAVAQTKSAPVARIVPTPDHEAEVESEQTVSLSRNGGPLAPAIPALKKGAKGALNKKRG